MYLVTANPVQPVRLLQGPPIRKDSSIEGIQDDSEEGSEEEGSKEEGSEEEGCEEEGRRGGKPVGGMGYLDDR